MSDYVYFTGAGKHVASSVNISATDAAEFAFALANDFDDIIEYFPYNAPSAFAEPEVLS